MRVGGTTEASLVAAAQAGDRRALDELVAAGLPLVYTIVRQVLNGHPDADDVVQDVMLRALRQLPTLRLFKIRMDLEMEKGTEALAAAAEVLDHKEPEAIELSELDLTVIRATQGPMEAVREPFAGAAARAGLGVAELLAHLEDMRVRRALRRVAAILFHRRAGFSANGMGVWKVPEERILELGPLMSSYRGISHCYQRPTYPDWPYSVFTMAHGRSKEECDAILDSIAEDTGVEDRRTLYSSTEFKKVRLRYFTDAHSQWEAEHAG